MQLGQQQSEAIKAVDKWFREESATKPFFYLAGYAGTGKTTLAKYFREMISGKVLFGAYTSKAALVMKKKGCEDARTIHSMIYIPLIDKKTGEVTYKYNENSAILDSRLVIIDECSMVNDEMGEHLLSFGVPVLVLGDPAQLPPVSGTGYFTRGKPDFMLTEIHRQAGDNPIIYLATRIRNQEDIKYGDYGDSCVTNKFLKSDVFSSDQMLSGKNDTRIRMNNVFRQNYGYEGHYPLQGERLICLKNDKKLGMLNGEMYMAHNTLDTPPHFNHIRMRVSSMDQEENKDIEVRALKYLFDNTPEPENWKAKVGKQSITYGYCLTAHKSQGSQWDSVYVIDESDVFGEMWWRWLYTGVTRAAERVTIFR